MIFSYCNATPALGYFYNLESIYLYINMYDIEHVTHKPIYLIPEPSSPRFELKRHFLYQHYKQ